MNKIISSLSRFFGSALDLGADTLDTKDAQKKAQKAQYDMQFEKIRRTKLQKFFEPHYNDFANCLKNCLESNYSRLGVACPKHFEDLFCGELERIDGDLFPDDTYNNISFSFELKREPTNVNIAAISSGSFDYVPIEEIERQLKIELPKYKGNFYFNGLSVFPMPDRKAKVVVYGVDRQQEQIPYWGPYTWY